MNVGRMERIRWLERGFGKMSKRPKPFEYKEKKKTRLPRESLWRDGLSFFKWWRCRESNPGPEILPSRIYMLSSRFKSRLKLSPGTGDCLRPACLDSRLACNRHTGKTSPKSRRFTPALRARTGKAAKQTMLLLRDYNRQRLYLKFHQVYELIEHSACNDELLYPRRIRFTPILNLAFFVFYTEKLIPPM